MEEIERAEGTGMPTPLPFKALKKGLRRTSSDLFASCFPHIIIFKQTYD